MTYNVHRCIGYDGVLSPGRVAEVIARYEPDVVALQELDVGHARTDRADQPALIAQCLDMRYYFHPAIRAEAEHFGDAILSRHPMQLAGAGPLPTLPHRPGLERRGALWATVSFHGRAFHFLNTHLGLKRRERLVQVEALLSAEWLGHPACAGPRIFCGDFNAWPGTLVYRRLRRVLRDAQDRPGETSPRNTFPSRCPVLRIDHVFLSPEWIVRDVRVPRTRLTRVASDHLPIVAEVRLR
jgi:endonuclease/exonuclease/phosphatase family metal-dependent hydrolase